MSFELVPSTGGGFTLNQVGGAQGPSGASAPHTHGNISYVGAIGTTANLPLITGASGVVTVGTFGNTANTFCEGNDSRLSNARTPTSHAHPSSDITGTFSKAQQHSQTPYKDEDNVFTRPLAVTTGAGTPSRLTLTSPASQLDLFAFHAGDSYIQANGGALIFRETDTSLYYLSMSPGTGVNFRLPPVFPSLYIASNETWLNLAGNQYFGGETFFRASNGTSSGTSIDGATGKAVFGSSVKIGTRTIATLPSAASSAGERYQLSDSATIVNRMAFSNGSAWYYEGTALAV